LVVMVVMIGAGGGGGGDGGDRVPVRMQLCQVQFGMGQP